MGSTTTNDIRKRPSSATIISPVAKRQRLAIKTFWDDHYNYTNQSSKVKISRVFCLFKSTTPTIPMDEASFHRHSREETSVKHGRGRSRKPIFYYASPKSEASKKLHSKPEDSIDLYVANIQGLVLQTQNKCEYMKQMVESDNKSKLIALTETHLNDRIYNAEIDSVFPNFSVTRCDRDTAFDPTDNNTNEVNDNDSDSESDASIGRTLRTGGGCLLLASPDLAVDPVLCFSNGNCELIIAELGNLNTTVIVLYRPSGINFSLQKFSETMTKCRLYLEKVTADDPHHKLLMMGDFNFPPDLVTWIVSDDGIFANPIPGNSEGKKAFRLLADLIADMGLEQLVDQPTRGDNILDLVMTNIGDHFSDCKTESILSDHKLIMFSIDYSDCREYHEDEGYIPLTGIRSFNLKRTDQTAMRHALNQTNNWLVLVGDESTIETANDRLIELVEKSAIDAHVPKRAQPTSARNRSDFAASNLLTQKRNKELQLKSLTNLRNTDRNAISADIDILSRNIQAKIDKDKVDKEQVLIRNMKTNPKAFFKFANSTRKSRSEVGPLKRGSTFTNSPKDMSAIMSDQYKSVFITSSHFRHPDTTNASTDPSDSGALVSPSTPNGTTPLTTNSSTTIISPSITSPCFTDITLSQDKIVAAIKDMDPTSAPGPDGIPAFFYRDYSDILAQPLNMIFRLSLDTGKLTEGRAQAIISPQFKGGSRCEPANYRPVALTNHLTKILERLIRKELVEYLETNHLTNNSQHGFRAGRSTITQLLCYLDDIYNKLEKGEEVDSVYLDFAKAFDKVDHGILLGKLHALNIGGKILKWIERFLCNREQRVKVANSLSDPVTVTSGVPQGSVIGPLLFLVMMLDIDKDVIHSDLGSFADDTKVWNKIDPSHADEGSNKLQCDLDTLFSWAEANNMKFNGKKFQCISFGSSNRVPQYTTSTRQNIEVKDCVNDLGVLLEDNLLFHKHIKSMAAKGHRMAGWSFRTIKDRKTSTLLTILKSLVIPQTEYASVVWTPHDQVHINILEGVQRRFTSRFPLFRQFDSNSNSYVCNVEYEDRLKALQLYSTQRRHERYLIIFIFKIVNNFVPNPGLTIKYNPRTKTRVEPKSPQSSAIARWISRARKNSFFVHAPRLYNALPRDLRERDLSVSPTKSRLNTYKRMLDHHIKDFPDMPGQTHNGLPLEPIAEGSVP